MCYVILLNLTELLFNSTPQRSEVQSGLRLFNGGETLDEHDMLVSTTSRIHSRRTHFYISNIICHVHPNLIRGASHTRRAFNSAYQIAAHARSHAHGIYYFFIVCPTRARPSLTCGVITPNFILSPHHYNTALSCAAISSTVVKNYATLAASRPARC